MFTSAMLCNGLIIVLLYRVYQVTPHRSQRMFWQQHRSSLLSSFPSKSICKGFEVKHEIWLIEIVFPRLFQIQNAFVPEFHCRLKKYFSFSRRCWNWQAIADCQQAEFSIHFLKPPLSWSLFWLNFYCSHQAVGVSHAIHLFVDKIVTNFVFT